MFLPWLRWWFLRAYGRDSRPMALMRRSGELIEGNATLAVLLGVHPGDLRGAMLRPASGYFSDGEILWYCRTKHADGYPLELRLIAYGRRYRNYLFVVLEECSEIRMRERVWAQIARWLQGGWVSWRGENVKSVLGDIVRLCDASRAFLAAEDLNGALRTQFFWGSGTISSREFREDSDIVRACHLGFWGVRGGALNWKKSFADAGLPVPKEDEFIALLPYRDAGRLRLILGLYRAQSSFSREEMRVFSELAMVLWGFWKCEIFFDELRRDTRSADDEINAKNRFVVSLCRKIRGQLISGGGSSSSVENAGVTDALLGLLERVEFLFDMAARNSENSDADFDLLDVMDDLMDAFAGRADSKGLDLSYEFMADTAVQWNGDKERLRLILEQCLDNALKFTEHGKIVVRLGSQLMQDGRVYFVAEIADTGPGLTEEQQRRVFEPFMREESMFSGVEGYGLGLAIVRQMVGQMRGQCCVRSAPGRGSVFWICLPFIAREYSGADHGITAEIRGVSAPYERSLRSILQHLGVRVVKSNGAWTFYGRVEPSGTRSIYAARVPSKALSDLEDAESWLISRPVRARQIRTVLGLIPGISAGKAQILIVEDNFVNQKIVQGLLRQMGYLARVASNGQEALEMLAQNHFDLVLMDCQMPVLDGFAATRAIRSGERSVINARIPVIAMTARSQAEDRERCFQAGMDDFMTKPVTRERLETILNRWLFQ